MRLRLHRAPTAGSALIVTLVTVSILGFTMASYLDLIKSTNLATMRSQLWNSGIPVIEAGLEEALTQLYYNPTNRSANNWTLAGNGYRKSRVIGDFQYVVTISTDSVPVLMSQAIVKAPFSTNYMSPARTVKVTVTNAPVFAKGMVARGQIQLNGNNVMTDSFDSSDPNYSTNGRYDSSKSTDNGDVATDSALVDSLDVWNAKIYGRASTGPGGTIEIGPNGSVGDKAWHAAGNTGIEPGWGNDDMNVQFPDVQPPFSGGALTPSSGKVNGTNYTYVLMDGNYQLSSLTMSGYQSLYVGGNAILYVTGNVSVTGQATFQIATNATLNLFVGGSSATLSGQSMLNTVANGTNFAYWGLPSNTSLLLSGNAAFTGTIYAPAAAFSLNGGGNNTYDFVGASITGTVTMNGHFNFHYDENLGRVGPSRGYMVNSWNEVFTYEEL